MALDGLMVMVASRCPGFTALWGLEGLWTSCGPAVLSPRAGYTCDVTAQHAEALIERLGFHDWLPKVFRGQGPNQVCRLADEAAFTVAQRSQRRPLEEDVQQVDVVSLEESRRE